MLGAPIVFKMLCHWLAPHHYNTSKHSSIDAQQYMLTGQACHMSYVLLQLRPHIPCNQNRHELPGRFPTRSGSVIKIYVSYFLCPRQHVIARSTTSSYIFYFQYSKSLQSRPVILYIQTKHVVSKASSKLMSRPN